MKRKLLFWVFIVFGLICGTASYFLNGEREAVSASSYTIVAGDIENNSPLQETALPSSETESLMLVNHDHLLNAVLKPEDPILVNVYQHKNRSYKVRDSKVLLEEKCVFGSAQPDDGGF